MKTVSGAVNYQGYLSLRKLLSLQNPVTRSEHELGFILTHQMAELCFKDILSKNARTIEVMSRGQVAGVAERITRATAMLDPGTVILASLSDLTPQQFAEFRHALGNASGFQSHQFRELEVQGGLPGDVYLARYTPGSWEHKALSARLALPCLRKGLIALVRNSGLIANNGSQGAPSEDSLRSALRRVYNEAEFAGLREVPEALFEFGRSFADHRWRHLQVAQIIGKNPGTHDVAGISYLLKRLTVRFFPEIVEIRSEILSQQQKD